MTTMIRKPQGSGRASGFATFDRRLAKRAQGLALLPPVEQLLPWLRGSVSNAG